MLSNISKRSVVSILKKKPLCCKLLVDLFYNNETEAEKFGLPGRLYALASQIKYFNFVENE